uniref:Sugar gustatory receptor n=1 Tax=Helicoverpa armigera TaxID=29058 RepID=A0AAU6Q870_HELAM
MKGNSVKNLNEKKRDDFLPTLNSVFLKARLFGISGYGLTISFFWSLILFSMLVVMESVAIWRVVTLLGEWLVSASNNGLIGRLSGAIFYGNALISLFLSSKFVHSWRSLSNYWLRMETSTALDFPPDVRIRKRTIYITAFVVSVAVVEHILSMISATGVGFPPEEFLYRYVTLSHGFILKAQDYTIWKAIPIFVLSKLATALWNFQDLIIILISMGLSSRYNRLNLYVRHIVSVEKQFESKQRFGTELYLQIQVWRRLREAYVRQSTLVRMVDRNLGSLVLLSNINNLYFICLQIYLGIHKSSGSTISRCYFLFSLGWLIFRACSVVLAASDVHLHSQRALKSLHACPSAAYNVEIKRLQYQLAHDFVALTGMGFFSLRRELLLEVAAAILKYELVLIQYDK